ncbi:MAG: zinc-binding dehydrogenase [candidate division WS1 bacterium]|jgi:threonine dehydrogenase-like Zn-dependent dehydrogenase|nr:zinc-binding dehydrogenase [candidate division WS1 bacterium]
MSGIPSVHRILVLDGHGRGHVVERETPAIPPGHVLVRNRASMFSQGTQLRSAFAYRREPNPDMEPRPLGYQSAGDIVALGEGVSSREVGQRVACMSGGPGAAGVGAYHADYVLVGAGLTSPIPDDVGYPEAASAHLGATAMHAIRRAELQLCEDVLVVGLGVVGQFAVRLATLSGARVVGWDMLEIRRKAALAGGAGLTVNPSEDDLMALTRDFTLQRGLDCAFIAFGGDSDEVFQQVVDCMKVSPDTHQMGRIVIVGGFSFKHQWAAALGNLDVRSAARTGPGFLDPAYEEGNDYPPVFVQWSTQRNLHECLRLMSEGRLRVGEFITHTFAMTDAADAIDTIIERTDETVGVVLDHDR